MFYDEFINLCASRGISKQKACIDCGISRTAWNKWRNGGLPNGATIGRLAEYFGVTSDFLLGGTETEKAPTPESELSKVAIDVAKAYDKATDKQKQMVRLALDM